jgi:hypothetical protein
MRWITLVVLLLFVSLLLIFWALPTTQRLDWVIWTGATLFTVCVVYLSLAYRRFLATRRGFGAVTALLCLALVWLRWEWQLWGANASLLQNANLVVSLLTWGLVIGLGISSLLLLILKDASVIFLAASWLIYLLLITAVGIQYREMENLTTAPLGEQLFWGVPLMWATGVMCLAPPAFLVHLMILLIKELKARSAQ